MSPVASPNLTPAATVQVMPQTATAKAQPAEPPAQRADRNATVDASTMTLVRVKQMHPADLALLSTAARSIRLRG